jgi:hypothetical protein
MPWCPGCSVEYIPGKKKCPECGFIFADSSNGDVKIRSKNWTLIRETPDKTQADLIKDLLKANGFEVTCKNGKANGKVNGKASKSSAISKQPMQILVPTESARSAAALIRSDSAWESEDLNEEIKDRVEIDEEDDFMIDDEYYDRADPLFGSFEDEDDLY